MQTSLSLSVVLYENLLLTRCYMYMTATVLLLNPILTHSLTLLRNMHIGWDASVAFYYPRDAILARVFATATCLSVRLSVWTSVRHTPVYCA